MQKGKFIVLEGGEGAGKTTQIKLLKERYGDDIVVTREPGGTPYAEKIRDLIRSDISADADAKTMLCLFWAARAENMDKIIIPALKAGKLVVADRFDSSTWAYQISAQQGTDLKDLFLKIREVYLGEYKPDLYIYLNVNLQTGLQRKQDDEISHFETRAPEFYDRIHNGYVDFFQYVPNKILDANGSIEEVNRAIMDEITELI